MIKPASTNISNNTKEPPVFAKIMDWHKPPISRKRDEDI
jgi:hypothetical protein